MAFQNPFAQEVLVLVQGQIPVFGFAQHGHVAAQRRLGINQFQRAQRGATAFALVAVSLFVSAMRTGSGDVTVGQKSVCLFIVVLFADSFNEFAFVVQFFEKGGSRFVMHRRRSTRVNVKRNAEFFKRFFNDVVVTVHNVLRRYALFSCLNGDGHSVLVGAADKQHILSFGAQVTRINVGRNVNPRQVADVNGPVGIGQGRSNGISFEFFIHLINFL